MTALASRPRLRTRFRGLCSVLMVERIEPCLDFWVDRLGFEVRYEVRGDDHLEYVVLGQGDLEVMYRTLDSLHEETPGLVDDDVHQPWSVMYLQVDDLDELLPHLDGVEVVVPVRETIVGTREVFVREPSGRIVALVSRD